MSFKPHLVPIQRLPTDCARAAQPFRSAGQLHLAVAQFARDVPGQPANMHGGDSDIALQLYRWQGQRFEWSGSLAASGGEGVEYFEIDARQFLAIANIRTGSGPYDYDVDSVIYQQVDGQWRELQRIATFGAKQWRYFSVDGRHFLGLAQGVEQPGLTSAHPTTSRIYAWNGQRFEEFQVFEGRWGYSWTPVIHGGRTLLAYADHLEHSPVLQWREGRFEPWLEVPQVGGRAFVFFEDAGQLLGVFATISGTTQLGRFSDAGFEPLQDLGGAGARNLSLIEFEGQRYLVRVDFITGSREAPQTVQNAELFIWRNGGFDSIQRFQTHGATSCAWFVQQGCPYLVVCNSLSADVRFRNDSMVYRLDH
jgi:hypothetical protein